MKLMRGQGEQEVSKAAEATAAMAAEEALGVGGLGAWETGQGKGRGPGFQGRAAETSNPRDQTLGLEPSGSNSLRARGVMVRGEAWAAASPTGVGTYLNKCLNV